MVKFELSFQEKKLVFVYMLYQFFRNKFKVATTEIPNHKLYTFYKEKLSCFELNSFH